MDDDQQFCLKWNNHQSTLISVFDTLLENGTLVDCTLAAEGKFLKAHKVVLSACSPYFATLLSQQYDKHPIFILKDVKFQELRAMMDYMYRGEVNISQDQLAALLKAAESLQIKGLSDSRSGGGVGSGTGQKQSTNEHKQLSVPARTVAKGSAPSGFTIEQKRARHAIGGPLSIDSQEMSGSREGSSSPTSRKRKKLRRRSVDNINADNHEHSNSSSQSMQQINSSIPPSNTSATAITSVSSAAAQQSTSTIVAASVSASGGNGATISSGLNVTKKTDSVSSNAKLETGMEHDMDNDDNDDDDDDEHDENEKPIIVRKEQNHNKRKQQHHGESDNGTGKDNTGGEMLIEPKSEYDDGNDETVEDLTLDDEELLEDLEQAGPSHGGGEGSSQGYAQWQVDRSQDDVFMAAQEAAGQQRDPQDLRTNIKSEPTSAKKNQSYASQQQTNYSYSKHSSKGLPVSSLSDMLFEFYQKNNVTIPKNKKIQTPITSPSPYTTIVHPKLTSAVSETELNLTAAAASLSRTITKPALNKSLPASKNLLGDGMVANNDLLASTSHPVVAKKLNAPFHPRIKYSNINNKSSMNQAVPSTSASSLSITSIPTMSVIPAPVIQPPPIIPPSSAPSAAAAIAAAAFFRDEYRHFHQHMRAQELLGQNQPAHPATTVPPTPPKTGGPFYIPPFMKNNSSSNDRNSENDDLSNSEDDIDDEDDDDDDDDDDGKYPEIDDIHLIEGSKSGYPNAGMLAMESDYMSDESHKYSMIAAHALRNLEYSLSDYGGNGGEEQLYNCRHCGKKYRWKSTLRRHENVECGGKEPSHQCPYCPYKSKQRGNLGVHVRKHHSSLPQLASKRRSKYSQPRD